MAEVLGVIASGFGVVSLAIQVAESINKLKALYSLIQSAPTELILLLDELETLSLILEDIDHSSQNEVFLNPRIKLAVTRSYRLCRTSSEALARLASELEQELKVGKKRGGLKVAMKKSNIEEMRIKLDSAKATMLLANQCYSQAIQQQKWESQERDMLSIMANMSGISTLVQSSTCSSTQVRRCVNDNDFDKNNVGVVLEAAGRPQHRSAGHSTSSMMKATSRTASKKLFGHLGLVTISQGHIASTEITMSLPAWIHPRRYQFYFSKSYQGWEQSLRSYAMESYDALVFRYSMEGNVVGLQELFQSGKASPFVIDPEGRSPLHYAALYARPGACRFLLQNGADGNLRTSWHGEFGEDRLEYRVNWYPVPGYIDRQKVFRGLPAYSTPLHFLATYSGDLMNGGREALSEHYTLTDQPLESDIRDVLEILVSEGKADPFQQDQSCLTVIHAYTGPCHHLSWLRQQVEDELRNIASSEFLQILWIHLWGTFTRDSWRIFLPEGKITKEIALEPITYWRFKGLSLLSLASFIYGFHPLLDSMGSITTDLIVGGSDLHCIRPSTQRSPILELVYSLLPRSKRQLERKLKRWLQFLASAGVDLVEFGQEENTLHNEALTSWVYDRDIEFGDELENWCSFEILELRIGETPDDLHIVFEDLYVSAKLAADFWLWVEAPSVGEDVDEVVIPGAWKDD